MTDWPATVAPKWVIARNHAVTVEEDAIREAPVVPTGGQAGRCQAITDTPSIESSLVDLKGEGATKKGIVAINKKNRKHKQNHTNSRNKLEATAKKRRKGSPISGGIQPRHEDKGKGNERNTQRTHAADPWPLLPPFFDGDASQL